MTSSEKRLSVHAPVEVLFRPVVDLVPSEPVEVNHKSQEAPPVPQKKRPVEKAQRIDRTKEVATESPLQIKTVIKENLECVQATDALCVDSKLLQVDEPVGVQAPGKTVEQVEPHDSALQLVEDETSPSLSDAIIVEAVPRYSSNPLPEYPYLARQRQWEGVVWLLVDVAPDGSVADLRIEQSSGYKILDRSANRTVKRWRFSPGTRAGLPVASQVRIPVRFHLEGG